MSKRNWIKAFAPLDRQRLLQTAAESVNWIEQYGHVDGDVESWDVMPGKQVEKDALLLDDASLYAGAAGNIMSRQSKRNTYARRRQVSVM